MSGPTITHVAAKSYINLPFNPPKGMRILPQNGLAVLFHIEKGTELDALDAIKTLATLLSLKISEESHPKTTPPPAAEATGEHGAVET